MAGRLKYDYGALLSLFAGGQSPARRHWWLADAPCAEYQKALLAPTRTAVYT